MGCLKGVFLLKATRFVNLLIRFTKLVILIKITSITDQGVVGTLWSEIVATSLFSCNLL